MRLDRFSAGRIKRTASEGIFFGGKGLNVSQLLNELGIRSTAMGFSAGYSQTGDYSYALKPGTACGGATAFSSGIAERSLIDKLLETL